MRIAVIGAGIAGLGCAHALQQRLDTAGRRDVRVSLLEANDYFGGHANTVELAFDTPRGRVSHGVDTGFLVFNERTYPNLIGLFDALAVPTVSTEMSFAVSLPHVGPDGLEWAGSNLATLFAQKRNLVRPAFLRMVRDILRFNALTTALALQGGEAALAESVGEFLARHRFSEAFRDWYLLPMTGCIWSCPTEQMLAFPIGTLIRFCHNHGLLQVSNRPRWFTVRGGSREYVRRLVATLPDARHQAVRGVRRTDSGYELLTAGGVEVFDEVVFACHSDQALALLEAPTPAQAAVLGAIRYQPNLAVLHSDPALLPRRRAVWSAWNYSAAAGEAGAADRVCVHYLINKLQPLPEAWGDRPVVVSLNPVVPPRDQLVHGTFEYAHPVFDAAAIDAQRRLATLQGEGGAWFCGAWTGYGFHEDGLKSGLGVAEALSARLLGEAPVARQAA